MSQAIIFLTGAIPLNAPSHPAKIFAADIIDIDYDQRSAKIALGGGGEFSVQFKDIVVCENTNTYSWICHTVPGYYDLRADQTDAPQVPVAEVPAE